MVCHSLASGHTSCRYMSSFLFLSSSRWSQVKLARFLDMIFPAAENMSSDAAEVWVQQEVSWPTHKAMESQKRLASTRWEYSHVCCQGVRAHPPLTNLLVGNGMRSSSWQVLWRLMRPPPTNRPTLHRPSRRYSWTRRQRASHQSRTRDTNKSLACAQAASASLGGMPSRVGILWSPRQGVEKARKCNVSWQEVGPFFNPLELVDGLMRGPWWCGNLVVVLNKIHPIYMLYGLRETFCDSLSTLPHPVLASSFPLTGISRKWRVLPTIFPVWAPRKIVSAHFSHTSGFLQKTRLKSGWKIAPFEKFRVGQTKRKRPHKVQNCWQRTTQGRTKAIQLHVVSHCKRLVQHNALRLMFAQIRARRLQSYTHHSSDRPGPLDPRRSLEWCRFACSCLAAFCAQD